MSFTTQTDTHISIRTQNTILFCFLCSVHVAILSAGSHLYEARDVSVYQYRGANENKPYNNLPNDVPQCNKTSNCSSINQRVKKY